MVREGIDVSQYQDQIDWELVKNHIDFAILRCGSRQDIPGKTILLLKEMLMSVHG